MARTRWSPLVRRSVFALGFALVLSTLGLVAPSLKVGRILIEKREHKMTLFSAVTPSKEPIAIATYRVALGPGGPGFKRREGDSVTPVGRYHIVLKKPSQYKVFMLIDYPNAEDQKRFAKEKAIGALPKSATIGGSVGIHGAPPQAEWKSTHKGVDWTLGCIAVDDDEIEAIAKQVPEGTTVDIVD